MIQKVIISSCMGSVIWTHQHIVLQHANIRGHSLTPTDMKGQGFDIKTSPETTICWHSE